MHIPLVDLKAQYSSIKGEIDREISSVIEETAFIGGKFVQNFETEFANAIGAKYCVGMGNGTDAIFIVLRALGVGAGDEVIVPANTFIATSEAVTATGARVVFADCDADDFCISILDTERKITKKTKAIIPVHLYGMPARMDELATLAKKHNLAILEDAAQAHLANYKGRTVGAIGAAACFSFYPGKNLGAYGDAGAITTNDEQLAIKCRMLANHGRAKGEKYDHQIEGYNSRLDGLQAAILSVKLVHLSEWTEKRRMVAKKYTKALQGVSQLTIPVEFAGRESVYHLYVLRAKNREALRDYLKKEGIETGVHYPIGLPFLKAYKHLGLDKQGDFPATYQLQNEILSLPMYAELTDEQIEHIVRSIKTFYSRQQH